jgi:hypothetical protein
MFEIISNKLTELGFSKKKQYFYKEYENIFGIIYYRKHTFLNGFFIDYGIFFKAYKKYRTVPVEYKKWHLNGTLGMFVREMRKTTILDKMNEEQYYEKAEQIKEYIKLYVIPFFQKVDDVDSLKNIYIEKEIFNYANPYPFGTEQDNKMKEFILSFSKTK